MHIGAWIFGLLALASLASALAKRPWTSVIARRHNPPEVWSTDLFRETNMLISGAWSILFAGGAFLAALAPLWLNLGYGVLLVVLGRLSPRIGAWYSSWRLRAMGLSGPQPPDRAV
jgi:hypothetical protein